MPVYNAGEELKCAIDSVLRQGVSLEIIAVDDASCDTSPSVLREYGQNQENFRVITFEYNRGVGAARSAALAEARGRYLAFCDADDIVPPGAYRSMLRAARGADVVIGAYINVGDGGIASGVFKPQRHKRCSLFRALFSVCCLWNKLIRREFVLENNLKFDTGLHIGEDVVFLGHLYNVSPSYTTTARPVYSHHLHSGSLVHTYTLESFIMHIECRRILLDVCRCPEAELFVAVELSPFLRDFLFRLSSEDFGLAFEEYKRYICELSCILGDELFVTVTGLSRKAFSDASASEYVRLLANSSPRERVLSEYKSGAIGLLWVIRFFTAWLKYKIMRLVG